MKRLTLTAALCAVAFGSHISAARPVPIHASIDTDIAIVGVCGATCVVLRTTGSGQASHLGRISVDGPTHTDFAAFTQTGTSTFTAADGSKLELAIAGTFHFTGPTDVAFSGTWTVASGTGRFADSDGTGTYRGTGSVATNTGELFLNGTVTDTGQ
jgi:hypothetical protein